MESGWTKYVTCTRCDYLILVEEPAIGHNPSTELLYDTEFHYNECTNNDCNEKINVSAHDLKVKTKVKIVDEGYAITVYKECEACYHSVDISSVIQHIHNDPLILEGYDATCTEAGLTYGVKCNICSEIILEQQTISALGHLYVDGMCQRCGASEWSQGLEYTLSTDGTYYIVSGIGTCLDTDIKIPSKYNDKPVKEIGNSAFEKKTFITSIIIPNSIICIGDYAFTDCNNLIYNEYDNASYLGNEDNPYLVLVKANTTEITSCDINVKTKFIHALAFYNCNKLENIIVPNNILSIGARTFSYCSSLKSITIPFVGATSVGTENSHFGYIFGAFTYEHNSSNVPTSLESVSIFSSSISDNAFYGCKYLKNITISNDTTKIGNNAFVQCTGLKNIYYNGTIEDWCNITFEDIDSSPYYASDFYILDENGIIENNSNKYSLLTKIEIPNTVTKIGDYQFFNFKNVTSATIPNSVTSIGDYAFGSCSNLSDITLGNSLTKIGDWAFNSCGRLKNIYYNGTIKNWCDITFEYMGANPIVNYDTNFYMLNNNNGTVEHNKNKYSLLTTIEIPSTVTKIGDYQFYRFYNVTSITIPSSVKIIGKSAFYECSGLNYVSLGNGVTNIGVSAYYLCSNLRTVFYEGTIEDWCNITFEDRDSNPMSYSTDSLLLTDKAGTIEFNGKKYSQLFEITIPSTVTKIGNYQFCNFNDVTSLTIPNGVISIGDYAFSGCSGLKNLKIPESVIKIGNEVFNGCVFDTIVVDDKNTKYDSRNNSNVLIDTFSNELIKGSNNGIIPNGITSIRKYAFDHCTKLISITIPEGVTNIGEYAFSRCNNLKEVYYEGDTNDWSNIIIKTEGNSTLTSATRYCYSETEPTEEGNYWHYDTDGVTPVVW